MTAHLESPNGPMKHTTPLILACFAFTASSALGQQRKVGDLAKLQDTVEIVFVRERPTPDGDFEWVPRGKPFKAGAAEKRMLENLSKVELTNPQVPLVGDLGVVALRGSDDKIITILGVDELGITFWAMEASDAKGSYRHKTGGYLEGGKSTELARWMYAGLSEHWPEEMAKREMEWHAMHDPSVDTQIDFLKGHKSAADAGASTSKGGTNAQTASAAAIIQGKILKEAADSWDQWNSVAWELRQLNSAYERDGALPRRQMDRRKELFSIARTAIAASEKVIAMVEPGKPITEYPGILACGDIRYDPDTKLYHLLMMGGFQGETRSTVWNHLIAFTESGVIHSITRTPPTSH